MSSQIVELNFTNSKGTETAVCHLMPCRIEHKELTIKAKEYFWPTIRELKEGSDNDQGRKVDHQQEPNGQPILTASFRGRPLQGRCIKLPDGFSGHVISKATQTHKSANSVEKHFDEFTYWNWDELPKADDAVVKTLDWIEVAKSIHDPI